MARFVLSLAFLYFSAAAAIAEPTRIYRCLQADGLPLFSRTACASAHQLAPVITNGYQPTDLTTLEQQQLKAIANNQRQQEAKRQAKAQSAFHDNATGACQRHQQALEALQNRRRKGYKLSEATRLDQQEHSLKQNIRLHC